MSHEQGTWLAGGPRPLPFRRLSPLSRLVSPLCCVVGSFSVLCAEPPARRWGAQVGLVLPVSTDLRLTTAMPAASLGLHGTWFQSGSLRIRPRADYTWFTENTQRTSDAVLTQSIDTRVTSLALGADFLYLVAGGVAVGAGIYEIHWQVRSTNRLSLPSTGTATVSGTSSWWRLGLGPVIDVRVSEHLEIDGRLVFSRYGAENQTATTASLGLLWHF